MTLVTIDAVATGQVIAGPNPNVNGGWNHPSGANAGVILVGFQYNTTAPIAKTITRTITAGGHPLVRLKPLQGVNRGGKGWGAPKSGRVEVWGGVGAAAAGGAIVVDLGYNPLPGGPPTINFTQFSGVSLTYNGCNTLPDPALNKGCDERSGCGRIISVPLSNFMDALAVVFVGSDSAIPVNPPHATTRFKDANSQLWVGDHQGPGTIRMGNTAPGGKWGSATVNLMPI
jgi:hypothetical protein